METIAGIRQYLDGHRGEFGGMYLDNATHTIHVNMAPAVVPESTRALHEIFRKSSPLRSPSKDSTPLRLELHAVAYSMAELQQVANQITIRRPWAALISNTLAWWGIDRRHDVVTVALTAVTQDLQDLARREFGNRVTLVPGNQLTFASKLTTIRGPVQTKKVQPPAKVGAITNQQAGSSQVAPSPSRLLDGAPYYGGERIYRLEASDDSVLVIQCTGGFGYSGPSMQTAGYCAPGGTFWTQGYWDQDSNFISQTGAMGRVFAVEYGSRLPDGELMNGNTYGAVVWTQLQTVQTVRGTAFPAQGEGVCFD
ncbi:hypothetical protein ACFVYA_32945 [Amycolatopsis sp. NPDC058278]|uniref:hypothetical protein n=1 Tax=Amycolatopsis sp. NPDC058278 TaxID=3346417 RepID=UPI0036DD47AE